MKIVPVMEFSTRNQTVFVRHINIAASSIEDAIQKYKDWDGKRKDDDAYVVNNYDLLSNVSPASGQPDESIGLPEYEHWRSMMLCSVHVDGEELPAVWRYIY